MAGFGSSQFVSDRETESRRLFNYLGLPLVDEVKQMVNGPSSSSSSSSISLLPLSAFVFF
jgi:hypothetical protein